MQDDRSLNCGMRDENWTAGLRYAPFRSRDRGYDEYGRDHNLAQVKSHSIYLRFIIKFLYNARSRWFKQHAL